MKIKLDENLGLRGQQLFEDAGDDLATVAGQGLAGAPDPTIALDCGAEGRLLVTLDSDFSNPFRFPPWVYAGISVIRVSRRVELEGIHGAISTLLIRLPANPFAGRLWILEPGRIWEYDPDPLN